MAVRKVWKIAISLFLFAMILPVSNIQATAGHSPELANSSETIWTLLDGPNAPGGVVDDLIETQNSLHKLYALLQGRYGERLFSSADGGLTWQQIYTFSIQVNRLAIAKDSSTTLFIAGQDGTFRSTDSGQSWNQVSSLGEALAVTTNGIIFVTGKVSSENTCSTYTLAHSSDNGNDWQTSSLECIGGITQLVIDPSDTNTLYVAGYVNINNPRFGTFKSPQIWRSQDGGQTFTPLFNTSQLSSSSPTSSTSNGFPLSLIVDPQSPERLYFSFDGIMISIDHGTSWQTVNDVPFETFTLFMNANDLYALQTNTYGQKADVYRSQDQGKTWWKAAQSLPDEVNAIAASPDRPEQVYAGTGGYGIFVSNSHGGDWHEQNSGIQSPVGITCLAIAQSDPNTLYAGSTEPRGGLFVSHDGGSNWQEILSDINVRSVAVSPSDPELIFAGDNNGLLRSVDGGEWIRIFMGNPVFSISLPYFGSEGLVIAGNLTYGSGAYVARLLPPINGAWSWMIYTNIGDAFQIQKVLLDPDHPGQVYVGAMAYSGGAIYKLDNDVSGWQPIFNGGEEVIDILISPGKPRMIYAGTYVGVFVSQDEGKTWTERSLGFPQNGAADRQALDGLGTLYTGTYYSGVFRWDLSQGRWIQDGLDGQHVNALALWPGNPPALLAGNEAGLWKRELPVIQKIWFPSIFRN